MSRNHMKNKTLAYEKILTVSSRILRKKAMHKKTFFSMMARVWEKGTYRKSLCCQLFTLFFFFFAIFAMSNKNLFPKLNFIFYFVLQRSHSLLITNSSIQPL